MQQTVLRAQAGHPERIFFSTPSRNTYILSGWPACALSTVCCIVFWIHFANAIRPSVAKWLSLVSTFKAMNSILFFLIKTKYFFTYHKYKLYSNNLISYYFILKYISLQVCSIVPYRVFRFYRSLLAGKLLYLYSSVIPFHYFKRRHRCVLWTEIRVKQRRVGWG